MLHYSAPTRDMRFLLHDFLAIGQYSTLPGFAEAEPDLIDAILEEGAKIAQDVFLPLLQSGDREGCNLENGVVRTPKGFREAYKTFTGNGWSALTADPDFGGQGLPKVIGLAVEEMASSANMALSMYPGLTEGAAETIHAVGSDQQKAVYLPKLISGEWSATMTLTEPHAGTDLGLLRTKAEPAGDGTFRLSGQKIFISSGEHDLTENIIHLVLAKIPGGPEGVKGISLFIVPKYLVNDDGSLGPRNSVHCGAIEEKMGIHGNATCQMFYEDATGYLLGEEHAGLKAMFIMMNAARIAVGIQGLAQAELAYQNAAAYANERLQGRALGKPVNPDGPADPLIVHPDVRRMLMRSSAFIEGARALAFWTALRLDLSKRAGQENERQKANDLVALLTPVIKAHFSDMGVEIANEAMQIFGGHGYIRETGMEQIVRDARITRIYEGANGIHALDLVGRKLPENGGRAIKHYMKLMGRQARKNRFTGPLRPYNKAFRKSLRDLKWATLALMRHGRKNPADAIAVSMDYLYLLALVSLGYMWSQTAELAHQRRQRQDADTEFYEHKLKLADFFFDHVIPETRLLRHRIRRGGGATMAMKAEAFERS